MWVQSYIELCFSELIWAEKHQNGVYLCIITQRSPDRARKIKFQAYFLNYLQIFFNWTKNITMESFFNLWKSLMIEIDGTVVVHWIRSGAGYGKGGWWMVQWVKLVQWLLCIEFEAQGTEKVDPPEVPIMGLWLSVNCVHTLYNCSVCQFLRGCVQQ